MTHIVWDWNGTLFDDLDLVVAAVNATLHRLGAPPITPDDYRDHYMRPVAGFYERLLGRPVTASEFGLIDDEFHLAYRAMLRRGRLARDAGAALQAVRGGGGSQSLLSMWWHDELVPYAGVYGVAGYMLAVDGNRHDVGETKLEHLRRHLARLDADHGVAAEKVTVVGDAIDDAAAAGAAGVSCVLYDGGSHHRRELDAAGCPVATTLLEAVELAGISPAARSGPGRSAVPPARR